MPPLKLKIILESSYILQYSLSARSCSFEFHFLDLRELLHLDNFKGSNKVWLQGSISIYHIVLLFLY